MAVVMRSTGMPIAFSRSANPAISCCWSPAVPASSSQSRMPTAWGSNASGTRDTSPPSAEQVGIWLAEIGGWTDRTDGDMEA